MMPRMMLPGGISRRRWRSLSRWIAIVLLSLAPATTALAARQEVEEEPVDARLEGYKDNVSLPAASNGLTWMAFVALMVLVAAGLFKDAKRTHLD
jgi:hypothetical protein